MTNPAQLGIFAAREQAREDVAHEQFLQAAIDELGAQADEVRNIHEAAIRNEDWRVARRYTQRRMWPIQTDRLNLECALEDLKA